uniref:BPTI/Kunitz inhibitor domain-containing protein n=1 Tax=Anas platyrhynchos TaxID=8839 RepID=A0A8B9ZIU4_ANAPL
HSGSNLRFELALRQLRLSPPQKNTVRFPCAMSPNPMDEGSCRHYALRWYFHPMTNSCRPFIFGGCRGNGNRFESKWECEQHCKTSAGEAAPGSPILLFLRRKQENPSVIHPGASLASPATKDLGLSLKLEELPWSSPACEQSRTSLRVYLLCLQRHFTNTRKLKVGIYKFRSLLEFSGGPYLVG